MAEFVRGLSLCHAFFFEIAKPILDRHFPKLDYTAGLFGYGSDVLGYDDEVSRDHMWGPRFYLLLPETEVGLKAEILRVCSKEFPPVFHGFHVNFSTPDPDDGGVRCAEPAQNGTVSPLIFLYTLPEFLQEYLGKADVASLTETDWLALSEHRLLGITSGELYCDDLGFQKICDSLSHYPDTVRRYLIASQWSLIAEEQAFVRRTADCGDELGSRLCAARIAERLMRLCFLYQDCYAPYSKWFGTAFSRLPVSTDIATAMTALLRAETTAQREDALIHALFSLAALHNQSGLTEPLDVSVDSYFNRKIKVIWADRIACAVRETYHSSALYDVPLIGTMSQIANFTCFYEQDYQERIKAFYL